MGFHLLHKHTWISLRISLMCIGMDFFFIFRSICKTVGYEYKLNTRKSDITYDVICLKLSKHLKKNISFCNLFCCNYRQYNNIYDMYSM